MVGRERELQILREFYDDPETNLLAVTGRSGIGKTALIREFVRDKQCIFFTAYSTTERHQEALFTQAAGRYNVGVGSAIGLSEFGVHTGDPGQAVTSADSAAAVTGNNQSTSDGPQAGASAGLAESRYGTNGFIAGANADSAAAATSVEDVYRRVSELADEGTAVLVIDRYADFAKTDQSFPETLCHYMTEVWKKGKVKLILIDSSYIQMDKSVYGEKALLRKLDPHILDVGPLYFDEAIKLLPQADKLTLSEIYGICGGIPVLLETAAQAMEKAPEEAVWQSIERIFLSEFFDFKGSAENILDRELREKAYYDRLMFSLSHDYQRVNQLSDQLGRPKDVVVPYLSTLMKLGLVKKENPVTEPTNRRKTRYSLVSDYDRFWYKIIVSRFDALVTRDIDGIRRYWEAHVDDYMKPVFIRICHEYLVRNAQDKKLPFSVKHIGSWWENNETTGESEGFDLMATGEAEGKNAYIFARCFFQERQVGMMDLKELIELTKKIQNKISTFYLFFSVNGFAENVQTVSQTIRNIMLIDLQDML